MKAKVVIHVDEQELRKTNDVELIFVHILPLLELIITINNGRGAK